MNKNNNYIFFFLSWYHGRLDRLASEDRLKQANKQAGFLVRESERKPGSFVLSYFSFKSFIYHFK
jgi:Ras GTPase-activating protein 1